MHTANLTFNRPRYGTDHYKSYGGRGIFEPQEFFFAIKFLV